MEAEADGMAWTAISPYEYLTGATADEAARRVFEAAEKPLSITRVFVARTVDLLQFEAGVYQVPRC